MEQNTSIQDREYQVDHINRTIASLGKNRVVCAQLPTGGGKTVEFAMIVNRYTKKTGKSVLILVHRKELLSQAKKTIQRMYGIHASLIIAGTNSVKPSPVYIGMVESVAQRSEFLYRLDFGLVIIDEAHIANFNKMHSLFTDKLVIGYTATPISSNKKEPMNKYYNDCVVGPSIKELINGGYLSQNMTRCPSDIIDETKLMIDVKSGDFDIRSMASEYLNPKYVMNTYKFYRQWCKNQKTIIFNVNVEHSLQVTEYFSFCGFKCKHIDGDSDKRRSTDPNFANERDEIMHWFKITEDAILCNVGIAGVGFDEPTIKAVIVNLATLSLSKWLQMDGRAGRIIDEDFITKFQKDYPYTLQSKNTFTIIDLGGNHVRFGDWSDERDWKRIFDHPETVKAGDGNPPMKVCPNCDGLVHAATAICKLTLPSGETCLHVFDRNKAENERKLGELVLITKDFNWDVIVKDYKGNKEYFTFFEMGRQFVVKAKEMEVTLSQEDVETIFINYFKKCEDWYRATFKNKRFEKKWHYDLARTHFFKHMRMNFTKQYTE